MQKLAHWNAKPAFCVQYPVPDESSRGITCSSEHCGLGRCFIHGSQDYDLPIKALNKRNTYVSSIRHFYDLSLCIHSRSYPSKPRYKDVCHFNVGPCAFRHVYVNRDRRSFIHSFMFSSSTL